MGWFTSLKEKSQRSLAQAYFIDAYKRAKSDGKFFPYDLKNMVEMQMDNFYQLRPDWLDRTLFPKQPDFRFIVMYTVMIYLEALDIKKDPEYLANLFIFNQIVDELRGYKGKRFAKLSEIERRLFDEAMRFVMDLADSQGFAADYKKIMNEIYEEFVRECSF